MRFEYQGLDYFRSLLRPATNYVYGRSDEKLSVEIESHKLEIDISVLTVSRHRPGICL